MVVVTTVSRTAPSGPAASSASTRSAASSRERYFVWLSKANHTYRVGSLAARFAVHWLAEGDLDLAEHFGTLTGNDVDKFADIAVDRRRRRAARARAGPEPARRHAATP